MSRLILFLLFIAVLGGGAYYLSTLPAEVPTQVIETDATLAADAR